MMRIRYLFWGLWLLTICTGLLVCKKGIAQKPALPRPQKTKLTVDSRLVNATNAFGFQLYHKLAAADGEKNLFISPTSIEMALGMTYNGAAGSTKQAMANTLGVKALSRDDFNKANAQLLTLLLDPDKKVELDIANSLWGQQGYTFANDFLQRNRDYFHATIRTLDFAKPTKSAAQINSWVKDNTKGMIPKIVTPADLREALLVLVDALYFKGQWTDPFKKALTTNGEFTLLNGKKITVPLMRRTGDFQYLETAQFQAINLPYGNKQVSMYVFLPKAKTTLAEFNNSLTPDAWAQWQTQFHQSHGTLLLPRFKADYGTSLKTTLSEMGMKECFSGQANYSGMLPSGKRTDLFISDVLHKTALEVNEEGTVASAATAVIMAKSMPRNSFTMNVNRPFFLAIVDKPTGAILFLGFIVKPDELT